MAMEDRTEKRPSQKVNVEIFSETYPFKTDGDPEEIRQCAAFVDARMKAAAQKTRSLDTKRIAVLAGMQMASEYFQLKKDYDELLQLLEDK